LIPFVAPPRADESPPRGAASWRAGFDRRLRVGAIAAGLTALGVVAGAAIAYTATRDQSAAAQTSETEALAETVKGLKAKIGALEQARREENADLRKSVAELRNGAATSRDLNAALAQLNARADRLEHDDAAKREEIADLRKTATELRTGLAAAHDSSASLAQFNARADRLEHDENARVDKLVERIDHDAATHNADLSARLEKLEKKAAAPVVAAAPLQPATPAPAKPPAASPPPPAANVAKETTGSIAPPRAPIHGWAVRAIHGGMAIVEGPYGFREIGPGDRLPGAGLVERIERNGSGLTVTTDHGVIVGAYRASGYHPGPYGAANEGYGPLQGEF
jgi:hypothetical protein